VTPKKLRESMKFLRRKKNVQEILTENGKAEREKRRNPAKSMKRIKRGSKEVGLGARKSLLS